MALPDFLEFEPFNQLRDKMQAETLGFFELFDPALHLTGVERSELDRQGLHVARSDVHQLLDFTLVYKNTRIWVADSAHYHLARCDHFPSIERLIIGTSQRAMPEALSICPACLQKLQYQGYDDLKARKEAYSRGVLERFTLSAFWRQFHLYPVSEKRDMRKLL